MRLRDRNGITGLGISVAVASAVVALIALVVTTAAVTDRAACGSLTTQVGHPTRWTFLNGCLIETDDGWVPVDNWRQVTD